MSESEILKEEIKRLNKDSEDREWGLQKTNEAIKALYKDLERKNQELMKLDKLKSDFVSTVSHELRTPLAISTEGINLVVDGIAGPVNEKQRDLLETSRENLVRLNSIINDLLDISKIESGRVTLKRGLVDLKFLFKSIVDAFQKVVKIKKQSLTLTLPPEEIYLFVDGDKIIQVVTNLLNNAHKFTPESGAIELDIQIREMDVLCSIRDTGIGISSDDMPKLFGKFQQFERSHGPGIKGTGLGLAISKALIEMHGGKIWAESKAGQGTKFFFTLSNYHKLKSEFNFQIGQVLKETQLNKKEAFFLMLNIKNYPALINKYHHRGYIKIVNTILDCFSKTITHPLDIFVLYDFYCIYGVLPQTNKIGGYAVIQKLKHEIGRCNLGLEDPEELDLNFGFASFPDEAENLTGLINVSLKEIARKKYLLIVDDHPQIIRILQARLEHKEILIDSASDGEEALEKIHKNLPDLIVLDVMMPKMNGYELWGRLKEDTQTASIPIIVLTAKNTEDVKKENKGFGELPIIQKTGGFSNLIEMIKLMI